MDADTPLLSQTDSDLLALLALIAGSGGSYPLDLIPPHKDPLLARAREEKLIRIQPGAWGDSDYVVLTVKAEELLIDERGSGA